MRIKPPEYNYWSYKAAQGNMFVSSAMRRLCRKAQTMEGSALPTCGICWSSGLDSPASESESSELLLSISYLAWHFVTAIGSHY